MPTIAIAIAIAIVSRKGGSGKSTLATNLAAYFALNNMPVTLGDLDHQQSMRVWLKRRPSAAPAVQGWVGDTVGSVRPPTGVVNLVLDMPGGLYGLALAKVEMISDAITIPVSDSLFDRESASDCWAELRTHPRRGLRRHAILILMRKVNWMNSPTIWHHLQSIFINYILPRRRATST